LNVIRLSIPPLRQHSDDIPLLADVFCRRYGRAFGKAGVRCSPAALQQLSEQQWPGNVRELENAIQRAVALSAGTLIEPGDLFATAISVATDATPAVGTTVREMERQLIQKTLENTGGNRTHAARLLGISLRTLRNKLNEFGLQDRAKVAQARACV
jgi:DNA-binding NtrC family response regulator